MADASAALPAGSYDNRVPTTIGTTVLCLSIASVAVVLRTYTRKCIINQMGVDDYFAIASLLMAYGAGIAILCMTQYGLGRHVWMLPNAAADVPLYMRTFYVSIVLYCAALFTIKMTFLFQYYRVFAVQKLRRVFIAAILFVGGWSLSQLLVGIFICTPIRGFWDSTMPSHCIPNLPQWYANAAGNIFTDVLVLLMPFPLLKRLQLPRHQKLLLFAIFGLGFFTVSISVLRIKYLKLFDDFTWENVESSAWSMAEMCSGITCACLPTLRPFMKAHFPSLRTRLTNSGYVNHRDEEAAAQKRSNYSETGSHLSAGSHGRHDGAVRAPSPVALRDTDGATSSTEEIFGVAAARDGQAPRRVGYESGDENEEDRTAAHLGLRSTVRSHVETPRRPRRSTSNGGIQVQRDVYQTERQRGP